MRTSAFVATVVAGGAVALGLGLARGGADAISAHPGRFLALAAFTLFLQLLSLRVPGKGSVGVSAVGLVAACIALGLGAAMAIAVVAALVQFVRTRGLLHRALFDAGNFALSTGAAGLVYEHLADSRRAVQVAAALLAGLVYTTVNVGLLCLAMASSENRTPLAVWRERFHWARFHFIAFGLLAAAAGLLATEVSLATLLGLAVPPALVALSLRHAAPKTA
jgi:hypothetical protein